MNRRLVICVLGLAGLTILVHAAALRGGFIWDDDDHLTQNPAMTRPEGLRKIWSSLTVSRYYPLTLTTFWVQRRLWGLNPMPYHAVNIALHALNAALLFGLLRRLDVRGAWVAAALWAVHPVGVESVAWITELKNIQSGLFFLSSLLCWLQFESKRGRLWYALSLAAFAAALASKASAVVLPAVLLLIAWWQRSRVSRADLTRTLPFFALAAGMAVLTVLEQSGHVARAPRDWSLTATERLIVAGKALWFYAWKLVWPADLMFVYPRWQLDPDSLAALLPFAGVVTVAALLWQFRADRRARAVTFALSYFALALLPVVGFFDIFYFRYSFVADHFQYLASIGPLALAAAAGASTLTKPWMRRGATVVCLGALATLSWRHSQIFHSNDTLWAETVVRNPGSALAHNNLGVILDGRGEYAQAAEQFRRALAIQPNYLEAHSNLGSALIRLRRYPEAEQELQAALRIGPGYSKAHYALGNLYYRMNRLDEAKQQYALAIRSEPGLAEAHYELGCIWQQEGQRERAIACYENALRIRPEYVDAHNNLANVLASEGKFTEAIEHYQRALKVAPNSGLLHYNLGLRLIELRRPADAIGHFQQAVRLMPSLPEAYMQLAAAYAEIGRFNDALATTRQALALAQSKNNTNLATQIAAQVAAYERRLTVRHAYP